MTTITYKDGIIAYDSMITSGTMISSLKHDKHIRLENGDHYFFAGAVSDYQRFINREPDVECSAICIIDGVIKEIHYTKDDGYFEMIEQPHGSIGTGENIALGAMDAGATAVEAVKIAKKRDIYTGGKIRSFKL